MRLVRAAGRNVRRRIDDGGGGGGGGRRRHFGGDGAGGAVPSSRFRSHLLRSPIPSTVRLEHGAAPIRPHDPSTASQRNPEIVSFDVGTEFGRRFSVHRPSRR